MENTNELRVGGYLFLKEEDAALARAEEKKIEYLESRMDYAQPRNVLQVYKKANSEHVFKTPVGYDFLNKMRDYLVESGAPKEELPPVELQSDFTMRMRNGYAPARQRIKPAAKKKTQWPLISLLLNLILAVAVAAMFLIAIKSDNPNILNYEKNLTDKYAAWEQELSERERIVREKERELLIENQ